MKRAPFAAAALAVVTTGAAALLLTFAPAQAAETTTTTATTEVAAGVSDVVADDPTLTAKPVTDLKADGAKIEVDGENFPSEDVYVAVCASTPQPTDLSKCLGAPVTADGTNAAWAHIKAADLGNGSFKAMLTLPSVTGSPNCVTGPCSVYAAKDRTARPSRNSTAYLVSPRRHRHPRRQVRRHPRGAVHCDPAADRLAVDRGRRNPAGGFLRIQGR